MKLSIRAVLRHFLRSFSLYKLIDWNKWLLEYESDFESPSPNRKGPRGMSEPQPAFVPSVTPTIPTAISLEQARRYSELLKSVSHEGRLAVLILLNSGEKTVTTLATQLGLRQPATSQILSSLRAAGLVKTRRDGKSIHYFLANEDVRNLVALICRIKVA